MTRSQPGVGKRTKTATGKAPARRKSATDESDSFELRLYVAGQTPKSKTAMQNLDRICRENLQGRYKIEVVDLLKDPTLARGDQILAIPTLVRKLPVPMRKIIGDLSNTERVLVGLDIKPHESVEE